MKRSILISLLVIGAAATLFGAGAFAKFSTMGSDSGVLTAATLKITVKGTGTSLAFSGSGGNCPDKLLPGNVCTDTVTVTNTSGVPVIIKSVTPSELGTLDTCGDGDSILTTTAPSIVNTTLAPNATTTFTITATFENSAGTDCQGKSATVTVMVVAEQV